MGHRDGEACQAAQLWKSVALLSVGLPVMKRSRTPQVPKVGAIPGQLRPGCLLLLPSPRTSLCPLFSSCSHPYKLLAGQWTPGPMQQTQGPHRHLCSPAPLVGSTVPRRSHPPGGRSPSAATSRLRPYLSPHAVGFRCQLPPRDAQPVPLRQHQRQLPHRQAQ